MFQKGELVRIKNKFWEYLPTYSLGTNEYMRKMQGQEYKVRTNPVNGLKTHYRLSTDDEYNWVWDENWLEPAYVIKDINASEIEGLLCINS